MKVAIASGKGGTGKTTVAVGLALSLADRAPLFLDCDVEEPNAALFLYPKIAECREVAQPIPVIDIARCTLCGRCAEVCQYHAIVGIGKKLLVFPELCHGCGSCARQCPVGAIQETPDPIGRLERGTAGAVAFARGTLNVGEAMAVPVIRQLKRWVVPASGDERPVILDAPPGASCPVVEALRGTDGVLLVTEPTAFGLHDLRLAVQLVRDALGLPCAVVINRAGMGDRRVEDYCAAERLPVVLRIPLERAFAEGLAQGQPLVTIAPEYGPRFVALWETLRQAWGICES